MSKWAEQRQGRSHTCLTNKVDERSEVMALAVSEDERAIAVALALPEELVRSILISKPIGETPRE